MSGSPRISITVDPPSNRPFYTTGDALSGFIIIDVDSNEFAFEDVRVELRCDEYFPNGHTKLLKRRLERWNHRIDQVGNLTGMDLDSAIVSSKRFMNHFEHFVFTTDIANGSDKGPMGDGKITVEQGREKYSFQIQIPERVNSCPPSAFMGKVEEGVVGVIWTLEVVLQQNSEPEGTIRESKIVNIFPKHDNPQPNLDFQVREQLFNTHRLYRKGWLLGIPRRRLYLSGEFAYPRDGIPQGPFPLNCSLLVTSRPRAVNITGLKLSLVRVFKGTNGTNGRKPDCLTDEIVLGECSLNQDITETTDLTSLIEPFKLESALPCAFAGQYMKFYYVVEARVYCRYPTRRRSPPKRRREHLLIKGPVDVVSPLICYMPPSGPPPGLSDNSAVSRGDIEKFNQAHEASVEKAERENLEDVDDEESIVIDYADLDTKRNLPVYSAN